MVENTIEYKPTKVTVLKCQHKQHSFTCVCNVLKEWLGSFSNCLKIICLVWSNKELEFKLESEWSNPNVAGALLTPIFLY